MSIRCAGATEVPIDFAAMYSIRGDPNLASTGWPRLNSPRGQHKVTLYGRSPELRSYRRNGGIASCKPGTVGQALAIEAANGNA